jgi:AcrR family transcriptional regulator
MTTLRYSRVMASRTAQEDRDSRAGRYHHGDLRRTLMEAAVETIEADGPAAVSLRGLAARAGVSHAAPVHHFGDKAGLFAAIALEGFDMLADELDAVWDATGDFAETGVRYVHFAVAHPGYFEVMFRPDLAGAPGDDLVAAKARAFATLTGPLVASGLQENSESLKTTSLASWSIVHGLATLLLSGNLPDVDRASVDTLTRRVLGMHPPACPAP